MLSASYCANFKPPYPSKNDGPVRCGASSMPTRSSEAAFFVQPKECLFRYVISLELLSALRAAIKL